VEVLKEARGQGQTPEIILNCTVSRHNIDAFEKVFDLALEWGADKVAFEYVGEFPSEVLDRSCFAGVRPEPYFERRAGQDSLLLSLDQARILKKKIKALKERAKKTDLVLLTYNIDTLTLRELVTGTVPRTHCHVIRTWVSVDPLGNVLPCPFFHRYSIGNLDQKKLTEIWGNRLHRDFIQAADAGRLEMCRHCILSVERNANLWSLLKRMYLRLTRRGLDEN
jgi:radical SAM protein with 4Fe4S-binding SPASM domain